LGNDKTKLREKSHRYSKIKTKQAKQREKYVEQTIARLQGELGNKTTGGSFFHA